MNKVSTMIYNSISKNMSTAYLFSGGSIMSLINEFHPKNNINKMKFYVPSSEMSAGFCSLGHNKSVNKCDSVIITTSGPGITNIITPLTDAYCDGIPLLVISGDVSTDMAGKHAFQEAPALKLTKPITYWNYSLTNPSETQDVLEYALKLINNNKQVHINIPKDILNKEININDIKEKYNFNTQKKNFVISNSIISKSWLTLTKNITLSNPPNNKQLNKKIIEISNLINNSKKPVLYVGRGCIHCSDELRLLAIKANIPVTTTLHGLGIFDETHFLSLKMLGMHGSERANHAIQLSDCIICIGARFDDRTVGNINYYAPNAKNIIHINSDNTVFNKVIKNTINIYGDSLNILTELLPLINNNYNLEWLSELQKYNVNFYYNNIGLKQQDILDILNNELSNFPEIKNKLLITTGVGNHQMYASHFITHTYPNRFITSGSLGSMGSGNPMAIGAKIGNPNYIVLSIDGDQSFNLLNDLKMIMNYNIPIKIMIMNDSKQSMVNIWEKIFFNNNIVATETINPDYNLLGNAYNIKTIEINKYMDKINIQNNIIEFINYDLNKPIILNCIIDSDYCLPLVPPGNALNDMITHNNINDYNKNNKSNNIPS